MNKFKAGDRVRSTQHPDWGLMTVVGYRWPSFQCPIQCESDFDHLDCGAFAEDDLTLVKEEKSVTEFRAGDRVRAIADCGESGWKVGGGTIGTVEFDSGGDVLVRWDGWDKSWYYGYDDVAAHISANEVSAVSEASDELATLRAFKEMALAKYPDLGEPESDEDAAKRIAKDNSCSFPDGVSTARQAIAWARANPPKA